MFVGHKDQKLPKLIKIPIQRSKKHNGVQAAWAVTSRHMDRNTSRYIRQGSGKNLIDSGE